MKLVQTIINVVTALMLAVVFVTAGVVACTAPPVTQGLSTVFARDDLSPFDRNQLVKVADATRDYSFGSHDKAALYRAIYEVNVEYRDKMQYSATGTVGQGFPNLSAVTDKSSVTQLESAFAGASELYCYSKDTVAHLDDCYKLMQDALPFAAAAALLAVAGLVFTGVTGRKRRVGAVLMGAGAVVLVAFAVLDAWAAVNFNGFFAAFHGLFFSQGNWQFPFDSLLICSLPTQFWMGMGVIWLVVSVVLSLVSLVVGRKCRK